MTEKKTIFPSLRNQEWKKREGKNRKGKQIIPKYSNAQHHWTKDREKKILIDVIGVPLRNPDGNAKPGWEIWQEGQVKKSRHNKLKSMEEKTIFWDEKTKTKGQIWQCK